MAAIEEIHAYLTTFKKRPTARASAPTTIRRQERRNRNRIIKALAARMDRREDFEKGLVTMLKFANVEIRRLEERCSALEEQNKLRDEARKKRKAAKKRKETKKQKTTKSETKKSEVKKSKTKKSDTKAPEVETGVCNPSKESNKWSAGSGSCVRSLRPRLKAQNYHVPDSSDDSDDSLDSHDSNDLDDK